MGKVDTWGMVRLGDKDGVPACLDGVLLNDPVSLSIDGDMRPPSDGIMLGKGMRTKPAELKLVDQAKTAAAAARETKAKAEDAKEAER